MTRERVLIAIALAVLAVLAFISLHSCMSAPARQEAATAKVESTLSAARADSATDAINAVSAASDREAASEALTRRNTEEINHAPGADARVDPALAAAGLRAVCQREAYRDRPECGRLLQPDSQ